MEPYVQERAEDDIRGLPEHVKLHLSHMARNGVCSILSSFRLGGDVERAIFDFEESLRRLGL